MATHYSLSHLDGNRYRVKVSMGVQLPSGGYKQRSRVFTARNKTQARRKAEDWADQVRGRDDDGTFRAMAEAWYEAKAVDNKPSTMRGYRTKLDLHVLPTLGTVELIDVDRAVMAEWSDHLRESGMAERTQNQCKSIVRSMVRWGFRRGRISTDDFLAPLETKTSGLSKMEASKPEHLAALLSHLAKNEPGLFVIVLLAATTGARRGELLALRVADVNLDLGSLRIRASLDRSGIGTPKTEAGQRTIALPPVTIEALRLYLAELEEFIGVALGENDYQLDPDQFLFPSPRDPGTHWYPEAISKAVKREVDRAGLPPGAVRLHRLRNYSITALADAGIPTKAIADRHGHAKIEVTEGVYMGHLEEQDRQAATVIGDHIAGLLDR